MKRKTIITVAVTVIIMGIIGGLFVNNLIRSYEQDIKDLETINSSQAEAISDMNYEIDYLEDQNEKLLGELENLEEQVWNVMNGEDYDITIGHNDEIHHWTSTKNGWFTDKSHGVTKITFN